MMKTTYVIEASKKADGTVATSNSFIYVPKTQPKHNGIKWYEDKYKK